jgi:hypothetical protein
MTILLEFNEKHPKQLALVGLLSVVFGPRTLGEPRVPVQGKGRASLFVGYAAQGGALYAADVFG